MVINILFWELELKREIVPKYIYFIIPYMKNLLCLKYLSCVNGKSFWGKCDVFF